MHILGSLNSNLLLWRMSLDKQQLWSVTYSCSVKCLNLNHISWPLSKQRKRKEQRERKARPWDPDSGPGYCNTHSIRWSQGSRKSAKWIRKLKFSTELCDTEVQLWVNMSLMFKSISYHHPPHNHSHLILSTYYRPGILQTGMAWLSPLFK